MTRFNGLLLILLFIFAACQTTRKEADVPHTKTETQDGAFTLFKGEFNVSGVYPHLTTYSHARTNEVHSYAGMQDRSQRECGIGALAVWNNKLYMVNYAAHEPHGSEHKLYIVNENFDMEVFQESVGGTPAARMIHQESNQLFIGHYAVDSAGNIRVISIEDMPGRMTAIARHLDDPEKKVYYYDMEGMLYELDVHSLEPELLYKNPLPGWHGKGAYTSQDKLVLANNGEHTGDFEPTGYWKVDSQGMFGPDKNGVLAEYDGENFSIIERKQFTDVTTRHGVQAVPGDDSPLWAIGWDQKSLRLKVMEEGQWSTYLLPKATYNNDPTHGWFTEWPRIRELFDGQYMMDMHGTFFDFPATFSSDNSAGITPISSHLRYVPDFLGWNGQVILATDETSIQGNPLAGQPQSNLWFGSFNELFEWGAC